jgi:hypothetical protein
MAMAPTQPAAGLTQYDAIRRRLKSQFGERQQQETDAIQRRFASNGMVGSGAFGKAQEEAASRVGKEEADATAQLDFAEANELQRRKEVEEGRGFQREMFDKDLGFKQQQFGEQRRQFDQEFQANMQSNKVSAAANFIGDDIENPEKKAAAWQAVEDMFANRAITSPAKKASPIDSMYYDVGTGKYKSFR